ASPLPIVFLNGGTPGGVGLVQSPSRPGGNVTGFSDMHADLSGKYVQFATELGKPRETVNYLWFTGWADGQYGFKLASGRPNPLVSIFGHEELATSPKQTM